MVIVILMLYLIILGILILGSLFINFLIYYIHIERLVNTRICRLKCLHAQKSLRLSNLIEYENKLKEEMPLLYANGYSPEKMDKLNNKLKKCQLDINKLNVQLTKIEIQLSDLNKYKKD